MSLHELPAFPSTSTLRLTVDLEPPLLTVRLQGEIDLACADLLDAVTQVELADVTCVVIDLAQLEFSDLAGLRALLGFRSRQLDEARDVRLVNAQPIVRRLFELTGAAEAITAA
jgi:anti-anti-sigma factor